MPRSAASTRPSTVFSTCVVEVSWRPPPIQRRRPERARSTRIGSRVVSPAPQTKRGRTTTVSRPEPLASITAASACALVAEYGRGRVERERRALVDGDERLAVHQRRLGADVDEALDARGAAGGDHGLGAVHVDAPELLPGPEVAEPRGRVEGHVRRRGRRARARRRRRGRRARPPPRPRGPSPRPRASGRARGRSSRRRRGGGSGRLRRSRTRRSRTRRARRATILRDDERDPGAGPAPRAAGALGVAALVGRHAASSR